MFWCIAEPQKSPIWVPFLEMDLSRAKFNCMTFERAWEAHEELFNQLGMLSRVLQLCKTLTRCRVQEAHFCLPFWDSTSRQLRLSLHISLILSQYYLLTLSGHAFLFLLRAPISNFHPPLYSLSAPFQLHYPDLINVPTTPMPLHPTPQNAADVM